MPSNQVSNQRGKNVKRSETSAPNQQSGAWSEEGSHDYGAVGEMAEQAGEYVSRGYRRVSDEMRECTRDHEGSALFVSLAAGFGVGLVIGTALVASRRRPTSWRDRMTAQGLGCRLMERLESMMPDALADRLGK